MRWRLRRPVSSLRGRCDADLLVFRLKECIKKTYTLLSPTLQVQFCQSFLASAAFFVYGYPKTSKRRMLNPETRNLLSKEALYLNTLDLNPARNGGALFWGPTIQGIVFPVILGPPFSETPQSGIVMTHFVPNLLWVGIEDPQPYLCSVQHADSRNNQPPQSC